ncbi:MAG: hypothetical protein JST57_11865 [Bacteroidetes bacterium]|nr:hypothetical protein [Bacteroidota bacterium]MBS1926691.1 hypothetical protein [Bacteroidota bacterium]
MSLVFYINTDSVKDGFRSNMANDGMPWPKYRAYFKEDDYTSVAGQLGNASFKLVDRPGRDGIVFESGMAMSKKSTPQTIHDYNVSIEAADVLADKYHEMFLVMPEMDIEDFRHKY